MSTKSKEKNCFSQRFNGGVGLLVAVLLSLSLVACGTSNSQNEQSSQLPTTPSSSPSINPGNIAPGEDLAVFGEDNSPIEPTLAPVPAPSTKEERKRSENPEKPIGTVSESKALPQGTKLPSSGDILEEASRLDGYNSFVALSFDTTWEKVVEELRASLEESGWECYECMPFIPGPNAPKETEKFRYFLNMERDGHKVRTIIAVMPNEKITASMTFQG